MNTQANQAITLVATIKIKPEHTEQVKSELLKLTDASQAETGCIQYSLHQDNANPNNFITYEVWENNELMQQHGKSEHFQDFVKVTKDMIDNFVITEMTFIAQILPKAYPHFANKDKSAAEAGVDYSPDKYVISFLCCY